MGDSGSEGAGCGLESGVCIASVRDGVDVEF